jgi:RNA polymerase sigma factor (sigma-70 family)
MEDKQMLDSRERINYRKKYPELNDEIVEVLQKSDRKMEYQQYDLKKERYKIDYVNGIVTYIPSREDSYERLLEENKQFSYDTESVEDIVVKTIMIEKMLDCLKQLSPEELEVITELFFHGKSERQLSEQTGVHYMTIHDRKIRILRKLRKLMEK